MGMLELPSGSWSFRSVLNPDTLRRVALKAEVFSSWV
jgi:hypothetical protein